MAAVLWRMVLAGELGLAILITLAIATGPSSAWSAVALALCAVVLMHYLVVAGLLLTVRSLANEYQAPLNASSFARATISESVSLWLVMAAMSAEPWLRSFEHTDNTGAGAKRPVLLVHGLACNRGIWRWLLPRLRVAGFERIHALNLDTARTDIDRLANVIEHELLAMNSKYGGARVTIIAHSLGGVITRAALRTLGPEIVSRVVTVATPHHGAAIARMLPWPSARQIRPGSGWLAALNESQEGHWRVPLASIYSLQDNIVSPVRSSVLLGAKVREIDGVGHFGLLTTRRGLDCVMDMLDECA